MLLLVFHFFRSIYLSLSFCVHSQHTHILKHTTHAHCTRAHTYTHSSDVHISFLYSLVNFHLSFLSILFFFTCSLRNISVCEFNAKKAKWSTQKQKKRTSPKSVATTPQCKIAKCETKMNPYTKIDIHFILQYTLNWNVIGMDSNALLYEWILESVLFLNEWFDFNSAFFLPKNFRRMEVLSVMILWSIAPPISKRLKNQFFEKYWKIAFYDCQIFRWKHGDFMHFGLLKPFHIVSDLEFSWLMELILVRVIGSVDLSVFASLRFFILHHLSYSTQ